MTGSTSLAARPKQDDAAREFFHHSSGQRVYTDVVIVEALRRQYPDLKLTVAPRGRLDLLSFAAAGHAVASPLEDDPATNPASAPLKWRQYVPPTTRLDGGTGTLVDVVQFGKFAYTWNGLDYLVYLVEGRDGVASYPVVANYYILAGTEKLADDLILAASRWGVALHEEVLIFDGGQFLKSAELWKSVQRTSWDNVILNEDMKQALMHDVTNFFDSRETYDKLAVPWKRGIIYYGPPGNGKTTSIKAIMHTLYGRKDPVPTLYVRSLSSYAGPEYSISRIFQGAREQAPCFLVFEDLDSIVSDGVRSYFLNEVDGLTNNDGILMIGSTNHLERLDPGISKRPSRFDRKYCFSNPDLHEREAYCKYWQQKLDDNHDIEFPDALCVAIAKVTAKFSFAYIQEAFVAALLAIAARQSSSDESASTLWSTFEFAAAVGDDEELDKYILWREMKKQIKILREELG